MAALRNLLALMLRVAATMLASLLVTSGLIAGEAADDRHDLYAQATAAMLDRSFPSRDVDYLLLDLRTRQVIAMRWPHADMAIPVGSLLKPFVAMAYAGLHPDASGVNKTGMDGPGSDVFPAVVCHGKKDGCWRTGGHGSLRLERALAQSCNAYFLALAGAIAASDRDSSGGDALSQITQAYGLPAPPLLDEHAKMPAMLIGVTPEWRVQPAVLAQAYARLALESRNATVVRLLAGMRLATLPGGTAAHVGTHAGGVLAKTGTAPCVPRTTATEDRCRENGDGLVVLMTPAEAPRLLLLVRERGTTGAMTAELAGRMLARIEEAHAAR